jgi:hypothetical protein
VNAALKVGDDVSHTDLDIDDVCSLIEAVVVMAVVGGGVDAERGGGGWNIIWTGPTFVPVIH